MGSRCPPQCAPFTPRQPLQGVAPREPVRNVPLRAPCRPSPRPHPTWPNPKAALRGYFLRLLCTLTLWVRWIWVQTHSRAMPQPRSRQAPVVTLGTPGFYFENGVRDSHLTRACWGLRREMKVFGVLDLGRGGCCQEDRRKRRPGLLPAQTGPLQLPSPDPALHC